MNFHVIFFIFLKSFLKIAGFLACENENRVNDQTIVANCYQAGDECGINMTLKIIFKFYLMRRTSWTKCILHCSCTNAEFNKLNEQCNENSCKKITQSPPIEVKILNLNTTTFK